MSALTYSPTQGMVQTHDGAFVTKADYDADVERLRYALETLTTHYVALVNSWDAGCWDPENDSPVVGARAALNATAQRQGGKP